MAKYAPWLNLDQQAADPMAQIQALLAAQGGDDSGRDPAAVKKKLAAAGPVQGPPLPPVAAAPVGKPGLNLAATRGQGVDVPLNQRRQFSPDQAMTTRTTPFESQDTSYKTDDKLANESKTLALPPNDELRRALLLMNGKAKPDGSDRQYYLQSFKDSQDQLAGARKEVDAYAAKPREMDWSPLYAYIDSQTGSKLSPAYTKPETPEERQALALKLKQAFLKDDTAFTDKQIDFIKPFLGGYNAQKAAGGVTIQVGEGGPKAAGPQQPHVGGGQKLKDLTQGEVTKIEQGEDAIRLTESLISDIKANKDVMGPFAALGRFVPGTMGGNDFLTRQKELEKKIGQHRQTLGKAEEGGVLRKEDERKYKTLLADLANDPEVAANNLTQLLETQRIGLDNYKSNLKRADRNMRNFESKPQGLSPTGYDRSVKHSVAPGAPGGGVMDIDSFIKGGH